MVFFITGGSRGIGADLVQAAVRAGHDVAFTYVKQEKIATDLVAKATALRPGAKVKCYQMDQKVRTQVEDVVERVVDDFDAIDVAVPNAGITRDGLLVNMTDEEWDEVIATNLTGVFYVIRAVLTPMISARFGRIITMSSVVANGATGQANYSASKSGLYGLTQTVAKEYGRRGITANIVVPGFFETDMTREAVPPSVRDFWRNFAPIKDGRMGELGELSAAVLYLASKEAAFINGQELRLTAGLDWTP